MVVRTVLKVFPFLQYVLDDFCWFVCVSNCFNEGEFDVVAKVMIVLGKVATAWYWIWVLCYSYLGVGCMVCLL